MKKPRKPSEIAKVKNQILNKALEIITHKGFGSLTMRVLASSTGMTAPNIYNYFSGKDEIYITLVIQGFEKLYQGMQLAWNSSQDPVSRARLLIRAYLDFGMSNPSHYDIMFTQPTPKYDDYVGTPYEKLSEVEYTISMNIAALAQDAVRDLGLDDSQSGAGRNRLLGIWSLLHGMVTLQNSKVASYVVEDVEASYQAIINETLSVILPEVNGGGL